LLQALYSQNKRAQNIKNSKNQRAQNAKTQKINQTLKLSILYILLKKNPNMINLGFNIYLLGGLDMHVPRPYGFLQDPLFWECPNPCVLPFKKLAFSQIQTRTLFTLPSFQTQKSSSM